MSRQPHVARCVAFVAVILAAFLTLPAAAATAAKDAKADAKADAKKPAKAADKAGDKPADKAAAKADPPPASASPMAELKRSNEKLDKILQKNRPNWSPEAELQRSEVRKLVG